MSDLDGNENNKNTLTCTFNLSSKFLTSHPYPVSCACKITVRFGFNTDLCCDSAVRENVLSKFILIFYLYARTAKVLSF